MVKFTKNFVIDIYWITFRADIGCDRLIIGYNTIDLTKAILESGSVFAVNIPTENYQRKIKNCKGLVNSELTKCDD